MAENASACLHRGVRGGRSGGEPGGESPRGRQLGGRDDLGGQAELERLVGRHRPRQHQQLERPGPADQARQRPRRPGVRGQPDAGERQVEPRGVRRRRGSRRRTRSTHRRRPRCRSPRRSPAWASWRAPSRSACSARAPSPTPSTSGSESRFSACSRRSCPTQNARPVPVSTTARTCGVLGGGRAACRAARSSVALSSAFIASGRSMVTVATPSVTSYSTGVAHVGLRAVVVEWLTEGPGSCRRTARPRAAAGRPRRRSTPPPLARPRLGQQHPRQGGVGEQELAPLVDQLAADRERLLGARRPVGLRRDAAGVGSQRLYDRARPSRSQACRTSARGSPSWRARNRSARTSSRPAARRARRTWRGLIQVASSSWAYPRKPRPVRSRSRPDRSVAAAVTTTCQVPSQPSAGAVDARGGLVEAADGARGQRVARGPRAAAPGSSQSCRTMRDTAVRTAGAAMPSGASSRTRAATGARPPRERRWSP